MEVKTDTKEKFHVVEVNTSHLTANMTEELTYSLLQFLRSPIKNVVLNLKTIKTIDETAAETIVKLQQNFYESNASFVICELNTEVEAFLNDKDLLEIINSTPTVSEAGDIVQMEEIERDLLNEEDITDS